MDKAGSDVSDSEVRTTLHVPAREIPIPSSISPEAQAAHRMPSISAPLPYPSLDDPDAWRAYAAASDDALLSFMRPATANIDVVAETIEIGGARVFAITPRSLRTDSRFVYLDIHGGGLIMGGGECCRAMGTAAAARLGSRVWSVDYRMPPDHPYPAALDDCLAAYRSLLGSHRPADIIVGGGSAGGNLAAALVLRARDEGLPMPAAVVLSTPEVDLTESGDSFQTNLGLDTVLTRSLMPANLLYAAGHDLRHPYLSPLFGDFSKGFPPTLLSSGTRDLFLSNTVRMHWALRAHGVPAELYIVEAATHAGYFGAPEGKSLDREVLRFVQTHWGRIA